MVDKIDEGNQVIGYKLFKLRKNGTIGPLFINKRLVIVPRIWLPAEDHPTKGYAPRAGWHIMEKPNAPHLSPKGRVWYAVEFENYEEYTRPISQGGKWFLAQMMRVLWKVNIQ